MFYCEHKPKNKNSGSLGTRLGLNGDPYFITGETDMVEISMYLGEMGNAKVLNLGVVLGLSFTNLKNKMNSETFLLDVIHSWLQKEDNVGNRGKPTWRNLVDALQSKGIGQAGIANQIAKDKGIV